MLIIDNLVSSALRHRLAGVDPPNNLLLQMQTHLVDLFWDKLHRAPQSGPFLPKEAEGLGFAHLASWGATCGLQLIHRLLTSPTEVVWRPLGFSSYTDC